MVTVFKTVEGTSPTFRGFESLLLHNLSYSERASYSGTPIYSNREVSDE